MSPHLERAFHLMGQGRLELAEADFRRALAMDPDDPSAHAALAICLSKAKRGPEAVEEARAAIGLAPDFAYAHYAMARVLMDQERYPAAERAIDEAIRLDPEDADYWGMKASLRMMEKDWRGMLRAAEQGLSLDPRSTGCANLRGLALLGLGRKKEAEAALEGVLAQDPEDALSHTNQGWTKLERNDPKQALEHFREALRIDPDHEYARFGMVEALKARNPVYRVLIQYYLWTRKLGDKAQWGMFLAFFLGWRFLFQVGKHFPGARTYAWPLLGMLGFFWYLSWVSQPLFNLTLRLNRFGWYALTDDQRRASMWVGLSYLVAVVSGLGALAGWWLGSPMVETCLLGMAFGLIVVIPISATYSMGEGRARMWGGTATAVLAILGLGAIASDGVSRAIGRPGNWAVTGVLVVLFVAGCCLMTWAGVLARKTE